MSKTKVIYVASQERSGSTLISQILGQVSGFFSVGELYIIWRYGLMENRLCGCGKQYNDCEFWQRVFQRTDIDTSKAEEYHTLSRKFIAKFPWAILPGLSSLALKQLGPYPEVVSKLYEAVAQETESKVLVDASKSIVHYFLLSQLPNIDLYMVHLVRDPHGVEYSISKRKAKGVPEYLNHNLVKGSLGWMLRNGLMENIGLRSPQKYLQMNYETFVSQPHQALTQVMELLQEDASDLPFANTAQGQPAEFKVTSNHVIAGSPKRFRSGNDSLQLDETWKSKMPVKDQKQVSLLTRPMLKHYGYSPVA